MSTARAARDLDIVREALGMESLNFWGIRSSGILGLTYFYLVATGKDLK
jgi:hypothetical protein